MRYVEFRSKIEFALREHPDGLTWRQLKEALHLPYRTPCCTWVHQLEGDIGLVRTPGKGGHLWTLEAEAATTPDR